jgi:hypothetical protein
LVTRAVKSGGHEAGMGGAGRGGLRTIRPTFKDVQATSFIAPVGEYPLAQ